LRSKITVFTKKVNVKKQRRFDRLTVIFGLESGIFACAQIYTVDYGNGGETLAEALECLHGDNTGGLRHE